MRTLADRVVSGAIALLLMSTTAVAGGQASRPSPSRTADEWVTTEIQAQYFLDPVIKARTITVVTLNGTVTLTGDVNTTTERARAAEIAAGTDGVRHVVNHLTVSGEPQPAGTSGPLPGTPAPTDQPAAAEQQPPSPPTDSMMTVEVRTLFAADPGLSLLDIDVEVENGVVRLTGDVPDLASRTRAERLARGVRGVTEVRNGLVIKR